MLSAIDYQRQVHALATDSQPYLRIRRVSTRDKNASVKFELTVIFFIISHLDY